MESSSVMLMDHEALARNRGTGIDVALYLRAGFGSDIEGAFLRVRLGALVRQRLELRYQPLGEADASEGIAGRDTFMLGEGEDVSFGGRSAQ